MRMEQKLIPLNRLGKNNKGVTLIEVIAVIAVMSVVMAAVTGFLITGARMSANVSGGATAGMQEQTATEYINKWILECKDPIEAKILKEGSETEYTELHIGERILTTTDGKVCYNNVELCQGEIYFKKENSKITYILNGTEHVVHLRIASEP